MRLGILKHLQESEEKIIVVKRNGGEERYDRKKLERVLKAAWVRDSQIDLLTNTIETKIKALKKNKVHSSEIRDIVLKELKKSNPQAYNFYRWYQKKDGGK